MKKIGIVVLACALLVLGVESILFTSLGRGGAEVAGPVPANHRVVYDAWFDRFGYRPEMEGSSVYAPVMPNLSAGDLSRERYRIEDSAPPKVIHGTDGIIEYGFGGGPGIPLLPPIQYFDSPSQYVEYVRHSGRHAVIAGSALITHEDEVWFRASIAMPFRFRTREYVGTTDDFAVALASTRSWRSYNQKLCMTA